MDSKEAEELAKTLLREREYHMRCIRIIEEKLAKLSKERESSIPLP